MYIDSIDSVNKHVDQIFTDICKPNESLRRDAIYRLRTVVISHAPLPLSTSSNEWEEAVGRNLLTLVKSKTSSDNRGAILAIGVILDIIKEDPLDNRRNLFRFHNYLMALLRDARETSILNATAHLLGALTEISGTVLGDRFIEEQIPNLLEMAFSDTIPPLGAVLVMKELARHSPTSFFPHLRNTFWNVSELLRDTQIDVRNAAALLMGYLLAAMSPREYELHRVAIASLVFRVQQGLEDNSPAVLHGSLLALREIFLCRKKGLLDDQFLEMCQAVLRFRFHADPAVRNVVIAMFPTLAHHNREAFCKEIFVPAMVFLIGRLDSSDGPTAYLAIGHLTSAVRDKLMPYVEPIFQHVRTVLQKPIRRAAVLPEHVFEAIGLLAHALGTNIAKTLNDHLDLVFACELSVPLVNMLEAIVKHVPILLGTIQERLLNFISLGLTGQHYRPQGAPRSSVQAIGTTTVAFTSSQVTLALAVLGTFNFKGHLLIEFVASAVISHLDDKEAAARKAAASTACKLFARDPIRFRTSRHSVEVITTILDKLLSLAIVDTDSSVRETILSSLETDLDFHLAQAEYVRLLVIALHDEVVDNRILALRIIGRLATLNPGQVLPPLRKTLLRLLTELKYSATPRGKESAIRILAALMTSTRAVVEQHVTEVYEVLFNCGRDPNPAIRTHALTCLGQVSSVDTAGSVSRYIPSTMSLILASLEGSSQMRCAALDCLGRLCTNAGYVIAPIEDYPSLLPMLHGMLKREQSSNVRLQVIKVIGLLGALDPDRYQVRVQGMILMESPPESINVPTPSTELTDGKTIVVSDDTHQDLVVDILSDTLRQQSFSSHHHLVVDAFVSIAKTRGLKFASAMPKIVPILCNIIRGAIPNTQGYFVRQLTFLVTAVRQHIRTCVADIVELIHGIWDTSSHRIALAALIEALAETLAAEFGPYTARLVPRLLLIFQEDKTDLPAATQVKAIAALTAFASNLQEYLNLVVPVFISCYEHNSAPSVLRKQSIQCLAELSKSADLYPYTSRIVHSLMPVMADPDDQLHQAVLDALCIFTYTLGSSFIIFVPALAKALADHHGNTQRPLGLFSQLLEGIPLPPLELVPRLPEDPPAASKREPNRQLLRRAWDISRVVDSHEAWITWFTQVVAQFARESPSVSLRSCINLFDVYPHISAKLFCPALASCWGELTEPFQEELIQTLQHVVSSPSVPPEVAHYMLDFAEYMERNSNPLPISHGTLADYCFKLQAYAKALHHRELEFFQDFAPATIEGLIDINAMLRQGDAALGTLNLARQQYNLRNPESWYEKLGQWDDALQLYAAMDRQLEGYHGSQDGARERCFLGKLRCLHALGEWEQVTALTAQSWAHGDSRLRSQMAPLGAAGAWHTGAWEYLETYYSAMDHNSGDRAFYGAVSSIQRNRLHGALVNITKARDLLDPELTSFLDESPDRLDRFAVQAQMISELEEMVLYKELADRPHRQQRLRETWKKRLMGCQRDHNIWQRILRVRSLAVKPEEDIDTIVRFANLCRKSGRLGAAQRAMESLVKSVEFESKAPPQIVYAQLKLIWADGDRAAALGAIHQFIQELSENPQPKHPAEEKTIAHILARSHLKYGKWRLETDGGLTIENACPVLNSYHLATKHDPNWSKAWHTWAHSNLDIVRKLPGIHNALGETESMANRTCHIVAAIKGFFRSLQFMSRNQLQDTLSLLTLWFKFGAQLEVTTAMTEGFKIVACDLWLDVVPQIIARIQKPIPIIKDALTHLLTNIGSEHPQALVYPLTVAAQSPSIPRMTAALNILDRMCSHSRTLVEQARLVGRELSRVAISWAELWHEALQKSGRHYVNGDSKAMVEFLQPLYNLLKHPSTPAEMEFRDVIGPSLQKAKELCHRHSIEGDSKLLEQAWVAFIRVYHQLEEHMPDVQASPPKGKPRSLDLQSVSPQLLRAPNMQLAVPGTYRSGHPLIRISGFKHNVLVLNTKLRPRQLVILGSNGQQFVYLLKGNEDLRQDERVMQVIGLVNTLLARSRECLNRRLHLQRYTVIPLAPDVGLISWMLGTDTLQTLITEYRKDHKIIPDLEHRMIQDDEPDYERKASLARKLEVFESAMARTTGQDLYRIFWLKSPSSEAWVTRRTTYTRSLAVGNMICYLLGVGDRHPGNIVVERKSGKVIQIDFGDCFEVSFQRESLPEKVPFRLTRMLRHAMEVCGIQGGFKTSCEISVQVLRENKESLLAVLEALVYDPLINWRLVRSETPGAPDVASSLGSVDEGPNRRNALDENEILDDFAPTGANREVRNERALAVYKRVEDKLTGRDFDSEGPLSVPAQVERLIQDAISNENLCQHFHGWCAFW